MNPTGPLIMLFSILYCGYNAYILINYHTPEESELRSFTKLTANPDWENTTKDDSEYFLVYLQGEETSGTYYYLSGDKNAESVFAALEKGSLYDVLVDKNRFIWSVKDSAGSIVSYEDVKEAHDMNRIVYIVKMLVSILVMAFALKTLVNKEISSAPNNTQRI